MTVRVKICGITNLADARCAAQAGADYLGFILYSKSPRYVQPATVASILAGLAEDGQPTPGVGVFVNATLDEIRAILGSTGLSLSQLHGDEPPAFCNRLAPTAYKALRPKEAESAQRDAAAYHVVTHDLGPRLLIDAYDPRAYGGTGQLADHSIAAAICRDYSNVLLAGGLTPENVADAIRNVAPWGVDVGSGVETSPGKKDHQAVQRFIAAAKAAGQSEALP